MLASQKELDCLAKRIELAYRRRGASWDGGRSTSRVWTAAAMVLWQAHLDDADVPLDPELFVASQPMRTGVSDPWLDLAGEEAGNAYKRQVRQIIQMLRAELKRELQLAGKLIKKGRSLRDVLFAPNPRLSPLGRYILARRSDRGDLAEKLEGEALEQHLICPLYRSASLAFVAADQYPVDSTPIRPDPLSTPNSPPLAILASLN